MSTYSVDVQCDPGLGAHQHCFGLDKQYISAIEDMVAESFYLGSSRVRLYSFRYKCTAA